jgi:hypothetical protein
MLTPCNITKPHRHIIGNILSTAANTVGFDDSGSQATKYTTNAFKKGTSFGPTLLNCELSESKTQ